VPLHGVYVQFLIKLIFFIIDLKISFLSKLIKDATMNTDSYCIMIVLEIYFFT